MVVVLDILIGLSWLFPRVQLLIAPVADVTLVDTWAIPMSYISVALFLAYCAALLGTLFGSSKAKAALVVILVTMAMMAIIDNTAVLQYTLELSGKEAFIRSARSFWEVTEGPRWLFWTAFNYWYFFKRLAPPR